MDTQGHKQELTQPHKDGSFKQDNDFVLEKSIFSNVFEKDIRRVFIYKKAERLAKAIQLVSPAFIHSSALRNRIDAIAMGLVDAAIEPPLRAKDALSKELLALSSVLAIARTGGLLSQMNSSLIASEAQELLQEVASYEEPRLFLDDAPTLSSIAKQATRRPASPKAQQNRGKGHIGHIKDTVSDKSEDGRRGALISAIRAKGEASIRDLSGLIRGVSEKTIQRELQVLVLEGVLSKKGERRWTSYSLT